MKLIIANWKSHKSILEARAWLQEFLKISEVGLAAESEDQTQVVIAPPFPLLVEVAAFLADHRFQVPVKLAIQDLSSFPAGSYTGAVSVNTLKGLPISYAILGHSERRRYFHENHQDVANKVVQALEAGIVPIVCVDDEYIHEQAGAIPLEHHPKCIVAYEDLESIGTGQNQPLEHVAQVFEKIHHAFGQVKVIYGGSVNGGNDQAYKAMSDGVLVGSASLEPASFWEVVR